MAASSSSAAGDLEAGQHDEHLSRPLLEAASSTRLLSSSYSATGGNTDEQEEGRLNNNKPNNNASAAASNRIINKRCLAYFVGVPLIIVALLMGAAVGYMAHEGAFSHVKRDVRIQNGTVMEPNTKQVFPLELPAQLDGAKRVQRLVGLFLKTSQVPEIKMTMRIFVLAMYVDRGDGRKELVQFKSGSPEPEENANEFDQFVDLISSGRATITLEYHMVTTTPGHEMHNGWIDALAELWTKYGASKEEQDGLAKCFSTWFLKTGFKNKDKIIVEYNSKDKQTYASFNGQKLQPPCQDPLFGRAFVEHEFRENGNLPAALLPTLWNIEYDEYRNGPFSLLGR